jgi:hypothetical protein
VNPDEHNLTRPGALPHAGPFRFHFARVIRSTYGNRSPTQSIGNFVIPWPLLVTMKLEAVIADFDHFIWP